MPSFQDSAFIFFLALLLFGPKKLPELARYVGKLMNEFRRASNEFRSQMEEEFRQVEQAEQQKKIAAIEAAKPIQNIPEPEHPHHDLASEPITEPEAPHLASEQTTEPGAPDLASETRDSPATNSGVEAPDRSAEQTPQPVPIASSGDLHLMPPATGLPVSRSASSNPPPELAKESASLSNLFDSIPQVPEPTSEPAPETPTHA